MTAILPVSSAEYALQVDGSRSGDALDAPGGPSLKLSSAVFVCTTAGVGTVSLLRLPAGKVRIYPYLSIFTYGDTGQATALIDIGYAEYKNQLGATVAAVTDALVADSAFGASAADSNMGVVTEGGVVLTSAAHYLELESQEGVLITATVSVANADVGTVLRVTMAYTNLS